MFKTDNLCEKALANTEFRYLRDALEVKQFVSTDKRCFCYGAGVFGQRFAKYCNSNGLKLAGFIVSDNQGKAENILDMPVFRLSEIVQLENIRIVVAIREELHLEIANVLMAYREYNFVVKYICNIPQFILDDFEKEIEERSKLNLFKDYEVISTDFYNPITREHSWNSYYGNAVMIKKLLGIPLNTAFPDTILHAPGWSGGVAMDEVDYSNYWGYKVYVAGKCWRDYLANILPHKDVIDIGNYMRYEPSLYSKEEIDKYKQELGRTLLVFPYHSVVTSEIDFEVSSFIDEIEKRKKENHFDSVVVCMYYYDIHLHKDEFFKEKGYKIVTAGHILDYNFMRRLRSIIELSDVTMSNFLGSHVAYSVCLSKPHYLFKQAMMFYAKDVPGQDDDKKFNTENYENECNARYNYNLPIKYPTETSRMFAAVERIFSVWTEQLTEEQIRMVEDIWGDMTMMC